MDEHSDQTSAVVSGSGESLKRWKRSAAERAGIVEGSLVAGVACVYDINANQIFALA